MDSNGTFSDNISAGNDTVGPGLSYLELQRLNFPKWAARIIGTVLLFVGVFGIFENILVLRIFYKSKQLRSPTNVFIMGLAISDLCMAIFGNPLATTAALNGEWFAGEIMCSWEAFVVYFFGLTELYLLTAISVDRFIVIAKPLKSSIITIRFAVLSVVGCFAFGLLWSLFPFFGWSSYGLEASGMFCGLLWEDTSLSNTTFVLTIAVFCFFLPMGVMVYCYSQIYMTIRHMNKSTAFDKESRVAKRNMKVQRKMLKSVFIMCGVYWICWSPYAVVSFIQTFGDPHSVPIFLSLLPAVAAKSEIVWNPLIYVATNKQFRRAFYATLPCQGLRESLAKREEDQDQTSKESELDDKPCATTQVNQAPLTTSVDTTVTQTPIQTVSLNVKNNEGEAGPTKVDC